MLAFNGFNVGVNISLGDMETVLDYINNSDIYKDEIEELKKQKFAPDTTVTDENSYTTVSVNSEDQRDVLYSNNEYTVNNENFTDDTYDDDDDESILDYGEDEDDDESILDYGEDDDESILDYGEDDDESILDYGEDDDDEESILDYDEDEDDDNEESILDYGDDDDDSIDDNVDKAVPETFNVKSSRELELERELEELRKLEAKRLEEKRALREREEERRLQLERQELQEQLARQRERELALQREIERLKRSTNESKNNERGVGFNDSETISKTIIKNNGAGRGSVLDNISMQRDESLKRPEQRLVNVSQSQSESKIDYSSLEIEALWEEVKKFMLSQGVATKLISRKLVEDKFGANNVKKLYIKGYLIPFGSKLTIGK